MKLCSLFEKTILKPPLNGLKHIFIVDNEHIVLSLFTSKSLPIYITKTSEEFDDILSTCFNTKAHFLQEYNFIPLLSKNNGVSIRNILKKYSFNYTVDEWKAFKPIFEKLDYFRSNDNREQLD